MRKVDHAIDNGTLGCYIDERLPLVLKIHETMEDMLVGGCSRLTIRSSLACLKNFFSWADTNEKSLNLQNVEVCFLEWTESLIHRQGTHGGLKPISIYSKASNVASLLDRALSLTGGMMRRTRIKKRSSALDSISRTDRVSISDLQRFGPTLVDICEALSMEAICGRLPVKIALRDGKSTLDWCGLRSLESLKSFSSTNVRESSRTSIQDTRDAYIANVSLRTRYSLLNLRIEAELLIFIAQTGMNLSQAFKLKFGDFSYQSHSHGYRVSRLYKGRRKGEVEFEIYSEYRPFFERYLRWRKSSIFNPSGDRLFPLWSPQLRSEDVAPTFKAVKRRCDLFGVPYIGPMALRKARINWLANYTEDIHLTAQMAQHTVSTLRQSYLYISLETVKAEISNFHAITETAIAAPGPVDCNGCSPQADYNSPRGAPEPDCISPSGCLFCLQHRDIDSEDHVWSLATFRHLKTIELSGSKPIVGGGIHPATLVIDRITSKLNEFFGRETSTAWVLEAKARVLEGHYHPKWDGFIRLMEEGV
ncbi:site-specific integrase [Hydrogenophaga sp. Root209]|uniref:site-specific integrase n=1 Tax=Hydrogenophaga sp. Root209 TaxID=1736490 RepID=UPI0012E35668|nr:site-specific integrase [Hydrogenophaga sp. Root209]